MNRVIEASIYRLSRTTPEGQARKAAQLEEVAERKGRIGLLTNLFHEARNAALSFYVVAQLGPIGLNMVISGAKEGNWQEAMAGVGAVTISAMLGRVFLRTFDNASLILDTQIPSKPEE